VLLAGGVAIFLIVRRRAAVAPAEVATVRSTAAAEDDW
jgi:hypothetical protein